MKSGNTSIWRKGRGKGAREGCQEGVDRRITRRERGSGNQGRGRISRRVQHCQEPQGQEKCWYVSTELSSGEVSLGVIVSVS